MSQEAFALHAGMARSYMSRIERGRAEPRFDALAKLAEALNVSPAVLFQPSEKSAKAKEPKLPPPILVPFCADGSCFNPTLRQPTTGEFAVGTKDHRMKFKDFFEALAYLRAMDKARWLRFGENGKAGVVTVDGDWKPLPAKYRKLID